jgi:hypothetical protein
VPPLGKAMMRLLKSLFSVLSLTYRRNITYIEMASQVARQVEEKPNIASLSKLRFSSGQASEIIDMIEGTHFQNLFQLKRPHLAAVVFGAGPFWVEHCEVRCQWRDSFG